MVAKFFKGLCASGAWCCFDEFNRLLPSVLSVCSVQFKAVTDAIKADRLRFVLQDDEIALDKTCGVFITMNPGYLGRAELPEGLKALFRPITVVVPDLELICENMLMAEGFVGAKILAKKPDLKLAVPSAYNEAYDGGALREQALRRVVLAKAEDRLDYARGHYDMAREGLEDVLCRYAGLAAAGVVG